MKLSRSGLMNLIIILDCMPHKLKLRYCVNNLYMSACQTVQFKKIYILFSYYLDTTSTGRLLQQDYDKIG